MKNPGRSIWWKGKDEDGYRKREEKWSALSECHIKNMTDTANSLSEFNRLRPDKCFLGPKNWDTFLVSIWERMHSRRNKYNKRG